MDIKDARWFMKLALEKAEAAFKQDEVPVGAIIVNEHGFEVASAHNLKEASCNPCGHAEILAIQAACKKLKNWRLEKCTMIVTLEPCPMCLSAMVQSRIKQCIFGAYDKKGGSLSLGYDLNSDSRLNHQFSIIGGICHYECSKIMSNFFRLKRKGYNQEDPIAE